MRRLYRLLEWSAGGVALILLSFAVFLFGIVLWAFSKEAGHRPKVRPEEEEDVALFVG